jgi:AAHS family 3-hydroxyphenylpropionic acid transporter
VALIVALIALGTTKDHVMTLFLSGAAGFFLLGANYALYGVAATFYPQSMRGTGSGAAIAFGRVGSIAGPLLAGLLLGGGKTATEVVQYMAPVAGVAAIAVFALSFCARSQE